MAVVLSTLLVEAEMSPYKVSDTGKCCGQCPIWGFCPRFLVALAPLRGAAKDFLIFL